MLNLNDIKRIVLTGGPCAGKSSSIRVIQKFATEHHINLFIVEEQASIILNQSKFQNLSPESLQELIFKAQLEAEAKILEHISINNVKNALIVFDRGLLDNKAYCSNETWFNILKNHNTTDSCLRERYNAVLHLESVATNLPDEYTTTNNEARYETLEEAQIQEEKTKAVWIGHTHLRIIPNQPTFELKAELIVKHLKQIMEIPEPLEIERKFIIDTSIINLEVPHLTVRIEQEYLENSKGIIERIRKFNDERKYPYFHTTKENVSEGVIREIEKPISLNEYNKFKKLRLKNTNLLSKQRTYFIYENQYFELDIYDNILPNNAILEIELLNPSDPVKLPPFLNVIKEITGDKEFSNFNLAHINT